MSKRFVTIWFRHLLTDWMVRHHPALKNMPFVLSAPTRGRMLVKVANLIAVSMGVEKEMTVADARAIIPSLQVFNDQAGQEMKLLTAFAEYCIRFTPIVAIDLSGGLILDASGCAHLWGGESNYIDNMFRRFAHFGYEVSISMADTVGAAWALSRFAQKKCIVEPGCQLNALLALPAEALRLEQDALEKLYKLGLNTIGSFINMPRSALRRRFGPALLQKIDQALGHEIEFIQPLQPVEILQERLPCLDPILTATGIEIALNRVLEKLCQRLQKEEKGIRNALLKCYRTDGKIEQLQIGTGRPSYNTSHLFKLFELKIPDIAPGPGIELFVLEASKVEDITPLQETLWNESTGVDDSKIAELLDRIISKTGSASIHRYLPDEHYWPERSYKQAASLDEKPTIEWRKTQPRPIHLLPQPQAIEVTAPIPDYPPMSFRYKGKLHKIKKADGPERIEREWWLDTGEHRDYYAVEDEEGHRYWLFRLGHYKSDKLPGWFIHGFFA